MTNGQSTQSRPDKLQIAAQTIHKGLQSIEERFYNIPRPTYMHNVLRLFLKDHSYSHFSLREIFLLTNLVEEFCIINEDVNVSLKYGAQI